MPPLKGLYFTSVNKDELRNRRIIDKCLGQIGCFEEKGWRTDFITQSDSGLVYNDQQIGSKSKSPKIKWIQEKIFTLVGNFRVVSKICQREKYDYVFFRHSFFNPATLRFFRQIKKINPRTLIIVEISTFPYKHEYKGFLKKPLSWVDTLSARRIKKNVDYIASCSPAKNILGIPVLQFSNGVLQANREIEMKPRTHQGIRMVGIASNISYWHGFDRVIQGIKTFTTKHAEPIQFDIIGKGSAKKELQFLVSALGLNSIVNFIDEIPNDKVLETLSSYDMGFSTLGMHRKGVAYDSSMKSRDYAYAGLPFVLAAPDASFDSSYGYSMYVPQDDSAIDIAQCLVFLEKIKSENHDYQQTIIAYAAKNLTWSVTFKKIVHCIETYALLPYKKPHIIAFCYYFPPIKAIGGIRTFNIVNEFINHGFASDVFSTTNLHKTFEKEVNNLKIETTLLRTLDYRTIFTLLKKNKGEVKGVSKPGRIIKLLNSFPFNLIIGEGGLIYIIDGLVKGLRKANGSSILFSSYRPYADHYVAYFLKRLRPRLYWIADFRDLQIDPIRQEHVGEPLQKWINKKILARADLVTTVSDGLKEHLVAYSKNVFTMHNGIGDDVPAKNKSEKQLLDAAKFNISYTGSIYPNKQKGEYFFQALHSLLAEGIIDSTRIQVNYAGPHYEVFTSFMNHTCIASKVKNWGLISRTNSMKIQQESCINILLSWNSSQMQGILTGKFYEYLKCKKPVAVIINGTQDDEFEKIMQTTKVGKVLYNHEANMLAMKDYILSVYKLWLADNELCAFQQDVANEYFLWRTIYARLMQHIGRNT